MAEANEMPAGTVLVSGRNKGSAVIGTSPQLPGSTFGLTRLEANLPVGIPGKYDVESTRW